MEGRHEERERLRSERQAAESQDTAAQQARKRRVQLLTIGAFVAAAAIVALIIVISQSGGSSDNGGGATTTAGGTDVARVNSELQGLDQSGQTLGDANAPVTVTEYGDPQCPVCAAFSREISPQLIDSEVRPGNAKYTYEPYIIIGPDSKPAMRAVLAAGEQNRFWNYLQLFYLRQGEENSGYVTDSFLTSIAKDAGVPDIAKWDQSRNDPKWNATLAQGTSQAESFGFNGTPSIAVSGPKGTKALSGFQLSEIQAAIAQVS
jgi:protein-disulfide isomerase